MVGMKFTSKIDQIQEIEEKEKFINHQNEVKRIMTNMSMQKSQFFKSSNN